MSMAPEPALERRDEAAPGSAGLILDLDGFEGPIDLLLTLAREQKVDLARISILALAEQYLAFIERARDLSLEIAADYLVMAAWLTYLKSRLLLPESSADDEPGAEELAQALHLRLQRLDAIRRVAADLLGRPLLGAQRFARGMPEGLAVRRSSRFRATLHELLAAYVEQRLRTSRPVLTLSAPAVFRVEEALQRLTRLLGGPDWQNLVAFLPPDLVEPQLRRSALAAHLAASLELARSGAIELNQTGPFGPIYIRRRR
jgi:segregation and condensation protein A